MDDVRGEDYEAAKPVPARTRVTGDPWVRDSDSSLPEGHPSRDLAYWWAGFEAGVQAARDAVAGLDLWTIDKADALAAIDALVKEKP